MDDISTTSHALTIPPVAMMAPEPTSIPYGVKLNGPNFSLWSQVVTMFVAGRGRMGYLNGTIPQPAVTSANYSKWIMEDAIVKGWLIGAMEANVMTLFIRLPTAKNVWDAVSKTYYEGADKSILYDLSRKAMATKQAGRSVAAYYSDLQIIWQELDHRRPIPFTQADVINTRMTEIGEDRVYLFLAGLDDVYDSIRGDILRTDPLPGPDVAFSTVRREELRRHTMMNQGDTSQMAMAVKKHQHVVDTCFKKHGYPDWWPAHKERLQARKSGKVAMCTSMPLPASVTPSSATQSPCAPVANLPTTSVDMSHSVVDSTLLQQSGTTEATTEVINQVQPSVSVDLDIAESLSLTSSTVPTPNSPRAAIPEASIDFVINTNNICEHEHVEVDREFPTVMGTFFVVYRD
ncbi:hypothetical protein DKX38_017773 [Salix brachista]|uniref:Retrotransposon Copia-like N-terminal domain-containing protein n=1 Tax=Salix brachista TaxID=2182728 RepID=A0A5N5KW76_9ROSI|nr:hypothetical protein DKX38_017773 [Salix brachista]